MAHIPLKICNEKAHDTKMPWAGFQKQVLEHYAKKWQRFFAKIVRKNNNLDRYDDSEINHNDLKPILGTGAKVSCALRY
jgi:hypothetical protein